MFHHIPAIGLTPWQSSYRQFYFKVFPCTMIQFHDISFQSQFELFTCKHCLSLINIIWFQNQFLFAGCILGWQCQPGEVQVHGGGKVPHHTKKVLFLRWCGNKKEAGWVKVWTRSFKNFFDINQICLPNLCSSPTLPRCIIPCISWSWNCIFGFLNL